MKTRAYYTLLALCAAPLAQAQAAPAPSGGGMGPLLIMLLMFGGMYFLIIAPQRKKQKAQEAMISKLKQGDRVVSIGGIYGQVLSVKEQIVTLKVADGVKIDMVKSSIARTLDKDEAGYPRGKSAEVEIVED